MMIAKLTPPPRRLPIEGWNQKLYRRRLQACGPGGFALERRTHVAMVDLGGVVGGVSSSGSIGHRAARLFGWHRFTAYRNRAGESGDGIRHSGKPPTTSGGDHDHLPNAPRSSEWTP